MDKEQYLAELKKLIDEQQALVAKAEGFVRDLENRYNAEAEKLEDVVLIQEKILTIESFIAGKNENIVGLRRQYEAEMAEE